MAMEEGGHATVTVRDPSHRFDRPLNMKRSSVSIDGVVDSISHLSDEILHHIFSYIPTKFAIRTSVLSKRWRHVWSETPHLSFEWLSVSPNSINETLANSYSASKITSFHLCTDLTTEAHCVNTLIKFAMTHNVENLHLEFRNLIMKYKFPDFFYTNSSVKQLIVDAGFNNKMIPRCIVFWTSLRSLSLRNCKLSDESFHKILSGCPILESLRLQFCKSLHSLDLSQSQQLRRLEIERSSFSPAPMQILAPYIHYLRLRDAEALCALVDVSSLTEANVDVSYFKARTCYQRVLEPLKPDVLRALVQSMLEKFQNVDKLTLGVNFLQVMLPVFHSLKESLMPRML